MLTEQFSPDLDAMVAARTAGHPNVEPRQTADGFSLLDMSACDAAGAARVKAADVSGALAVRKPGLAPGCENPPSLGTIT